MLEIALPRATGVDAKAMAIDQVIHQGEELALGSRGSSAEHVHLAKGRHVWLIDIQAELKRSTKQLAASIVEAKPHEKWRIGVREVARHE